MFLSKSMKGTQMSQKLHTRLPHLKRSQNQIKHQPLFGLDVVRKEGKNNVIYAKEGYQQQGGFSQSPEGKNVCKCQEEIHEMTQPRWDYICWHSGPKTYEY